MTPSPPPTPHFPFNPGNTDNFAGVSSKRTQCAPNPHPATPACAHTNTPDDFEGVSIKKENAMPLPPPPPPPPPPHAPPPTPPAQVILLTTLQVCLSSKRIQCLPPNPPYHPSSPDDFEGVSNKQEYTVPPPLLPQVILLTTLQVWLSNKRMQCLHPNPPYRPSSPGNTHSWRLCRCVYPAGERTGPHTRTCTSPWCWCRPGCSGLGVHTRSCLQHKGRQ